MNVDRRDRRVQRRLARLPLGARRELLRVLASPPERRADVIRQMYGRQGTLDLAEVLMHLEAEQSAPAAGAPRLKESVRGRVRE